MTDQTTPEPADDDEVVSEQARGIKINDKVYPSPGDFTFGEAQVIKEHTGLTAQDLIVGVQGDPTDPTYLLAIAWVVMNRERKTAWETVAAKIEKTSIGEFFVMPDDEEDAADSPPPGRRQKPSS